ncbi:ribonuclease P protein component [Sulfuricurvum sp.]|uniref:ribonuclease P protein component n=1 Tax=Sulfuricurvum sp. TaxID=2025608 RepID=UPI00199279DD|nr:ribonuclease P protein component [Sulfuricurvum sp.]MBD3798850.1 ribonuclease P protein component [Campylobacterota bacterium]MBD3805883.1 ribonuclease P protein component [Sulfuricurvum sp.]
MLKLHSEFQRVYRRGKNAHSTSIALFYLPLSGEKKVGYTASKKVGNAVVRNRCKRRLRALFREFGSEANDGWYVFVAKKGLFDESFEIVRRDCKYVLKRTGAMDGVDNDKKLLS